MTHDIIGDIHGHADKLTALLGKMGYRHRLGAWRHPDRTAIFVGDFIDRGPGQLETIRIVREMLDAGTAQAVMGNHEFNAIAFHTADSEFPGEHLRRRTAKNHKQHKAFLDEAGADSDKHGQLVDWFLTLPLWLDLPSLRVVHACWNPGYMAEIEPCLKPGRRLDRDLVVAASRSGSMEYRVIETLIKGPEIKLPPGQEFRDKDGNLRTELRVKWYCRRRRYRAEPCSDTTATSRCSSATTGTRAFRRRFDPTSRAWTTPRATAALWSPTAGRVRPSYTLTALSALEPTTMTTRIEAHGGSTANTESTN